MDTSNVPSVAGPDSRLNPPKHPAKYSPDVVVIFRSWLAHLSPLLDPFAGVGTWANPRLVGNEIEYEWASQSPNPTIVGDAMALPIRSGIFPGACTSPTFGNRMADHHVARDDSVRNTYTHKLGHVLHANNTGKVHWGPGYWTMHDVAWREVWRVLKPGGFFAVHVSDFLAYEVRVPVVNWHMRQLVEIGFKFVEGLTIPKRGLRQGANHSVRVGREMCTLWKKVV